MVPLGRCFFVLLIVLGMAVLAISWHFGLLNPGAVMTAQCETEETKSCSQSHPAFLPVPGRGSGALTRRFRRCWREKSRGGWGLAELAGRKK